MWYCHAINDINEQRKLSNSGIKTEEVRLKSISIGIVSHNWNSQLLFGDWEARVFKLTEIIDCLVTVCLFVLRWQITQRICKEKKNLKSMKWIMLWSWFILPHFRCSIRAVSINMQEAITEVHLELLQFSQIVPIAIKKRSRTRYFLTPIFQQIQK